MSKNTWRFELPDYVFDTQRVLENMTASLEMANRVSQTLSATQNLSGAYAAVESLQTVLRNVYSNSAFEALTKSATAMQSVLSSIQVPTVVDMIPTMERILPIINTTWKKPSIDWDWMSKALATYDYNHDDVEELLTNEICEELNESVHDTLVAKDSQKNIEQRYGEWKEKHPLLADLYLQIISFILGIITGIITSWIPATTTKNSNVYELPASTSNIIINVDINQNITIVNEVPYYYEVIYTDPETGEEKRGYIYKPNVAIPQQEFDSDAKKSESDPQ